MAQNPSLSRSLGNSPMDKVNPVNDPKFANGQGYNEFDLSHSAPDTQRFGELLPCLFFEGVPGDRVLLRSDSEVKANGLTDSLLSQVSRSEDYFMVPYSAMYPRNWSKIFTNPTKGDDVPRNALPSFPIKAFMSYLSLLIEPDSADYTIDIDGTLLSLHSSVFNATPSIAPNYPTTPTLSDSYAVWIRINLLSRFFTLVSPDSILSHAGFKPYFFRNVSARSPISEGQFFYGFNPGDIFDVHDAVNSFFSLIQNFYSVQSENYTNGLVSIAVLTPASNGNDDDLSQSSFGSFQSRLIHPKSLLDLREIIFSCINNGDLFLFVSQDTLGSSAFTPISNTNFFTSLDPAISFAQSMSSSLVDHDIETDISSETPGITTAFLDLSRVLAYQLSIAQYGTVDDIDYLYTSQLYLQNLESDLLTPLSDSISDIPAALVPTFSYNGVTTPYDILTAGFILPNLRNSIGHLPRLLFLYANLFAPRYALKFRDYFGSSRPNVLAVGDLTINVTNNQVQTVDITKNIVMQRFLNAANRVGSKLLNYALGIFGIKPANIEAEPHFIARRSTDIGRNFVTNTSSEQGKQTTNLESTSSQYAFDIFIDEPCIVLAVRSFTAVGSYEFGISKHLTNFDRFQKFNPMIQNIGDQPVYATELTGSSLGSSTTTPFGYTLRYGEYKNAVSYASGGVSSSLPSVFFLNEANHPSNYVGNEFASSAASTPRIKPSFIRLYPYMFDRFYNSLSSISPIYYFHFSISQVNSIQALRKMDFQPGILWN